MALTELFIRNIKPSEATAGVKYADAQGLYLHVKGPGKYWRMNYRFKGKQKTLALGVYPTVSLAKARRRRDEARELLADGSDPSSAKQEVKRVTGFALTETFGAIAQLWLIKTRSTRMDSTQGKIATWLKKDILPHIGDQPIKDLAPKDILAMVGIMEARGAHSSSHRILNVCGQIFRFAVASDLVERDITADLKGALTVPVKGNFTAIVEPKKFASLLRAIYDYSGHPTTIAALKLTTMTALRPGELRQAMWSEFDLNQAVWNIPGDRMKMKLDHLVPLSTQAVGILRQLHTITGRGQYVFPSIRTGERPMSENTINAALRGMGYDKETHTAHGFRASFRTIGDEVLGERVDLLEHQLSHKVKDPNGNAYNRTTHLPARLQMMQRWSDYLDTARNNLSQT